MAQKNIPGRLWCAGVIGLLLCLSGGSSSAQPLRLGVFPNLSAERVLEQYEPVRRHLEQALQRPVQLSTGSDFPAFVTRTQQGEFDLVVTAPHFARLAQTHSAYLPLLQYAEPAHGMLVVQAGSGLRDMGQLQGAEIASPDPLALVTLLGVQLMADNGLRLDEHYQLQPARSHLEAAQQLQKGRVRAAFLGSVPFFQLPPALKRDLRVLAATPPMPGHVWLVHRRIKEPLRRQVQAALDTFAVSEAGQQFMRQYGLGGLIPAREAALRSMDPYAREVRRRLSGH